MPAYKPATVLRHASVFTSSVLVSSAISGLVGLAIARLLTPALYGLFQSIQLFWQYGPYVSSGTLWAMQQEIARHESADRASDATRAADVTWTFVVASSLALTVAVLLVAQMFDWPYAPSLSAAVAVVVGTRQLYALCQAVLTARRRFWVAGSGDIVTSVLNLLLTAALTYRYQLAGLLVAQASWALLGAALLAWTGRLRFRWTGDWHRLAGQLRLGLVFSVNGLLQVTAKNAGRLVTLVMAGTGTLAFYGVALLVAGYAELVGGAIGRSLFPSVVGAYEQRRDAADIRGYVIQAGQVLAALLPVATGLASLTLSVAIRLILPRYTAGILPGQILVFGTSFLILRYAVEPFFVALGRLHHTFLIQGPAIGLGAVVAVVAFAHGFGLAGVAAGTTLGYALIAIGLSGYAYRYYAPDLLAWLALMARLYVPICYGGVALLFVSPLLRLGGATDHVSGLLVAAPVYAVLCLPLLWSANRQGRLRQRLPGRLEEG